MCWVACALHKLVLPRHVHDLVGEAFQDLVSSFSTRLAMFQRRSDFQDLFNSLVFSFRRHHVFVFHVSSLFQRSFVKRPIFHDLCYAPKR